MAEVKISPAVVIGGLLLAVGAVLGLATLAQAAPLPPPPEGYPCPYCPEVFLTYEELVAHIQAVHPLERIPIHIVWE